MNSNERFQNSVDSTASLSPELKEFKRELDAAFANEDSANPCYIENSDRIHNALIFSKVLSHSKEIEMFCGEMSIFRRAFYDYVRSQNPEDDYEYCLKCMEEGLRTFVSKNDSVLNIYVEKWNDKYLEDICIVRPSFMRALKDKRIRIFKEKAFSVGIPSNMYHVTMGDNKWIRVEFDRKEHKGTFASPASELSRTSARNFFENLKVLTEPIDAYN